MQFCHCITNTIQLDNVMSIFRNTFTPEVQEQLKARQNAAQRKNPNDIIYMNSRNSWIKMTSSVDVKGDGGALASQYILKGGVIGPKLDGKLILKAGVGDDQYSAYNYNSPSGNPYQRGLRPMPGITSMDIKSGTAYGSLRTVTVNFVCHDIKQLEDLELLYMRPGYTVLIEWGWAPYLKTDPILKTPPQPESNVEFYDGLFTKNTNRNKVFSDLFKLSRKQSGNYDAMLGYVKNYNWTARMDGGYDCTTTVISIGEILESLRINWIPFNINDIANKNGLLNSSPVNIPASAQGPSVASGASAALIAGGNIAYNPPLFNTPPSNSYTGIAKNSSLDANKIKENYSKNILAGLCYELYSNFSTQKLYTLFSMVLNNTNPDPNTINTGGVQVYITLGDFVDLLNKYVILAINKDNKTESTPIIEVSVKPNQYYTGNLSLEEQDSLLCLAHPLQTSIDPTVCLITSPLWAGGIDFSGISDGANNGSSYTPAATEIFNKLQVSDFNRDDSKIAINLLTSNIKSSSNAKEFVRAFYNIAKQKNSQYTTKDVLTILSQTKKYTTDILTPDADGNPDPIYETLFSIETYNAVRDEEAKKISDDEKAAKNETTSFQVEYLKDLDKTKKPFQYKNDELGKISNIFLNLNRLYQLSISPELQDQKTQEIKLYQYLKQVLKEVQDSIGGINSFDIHVDPIDNVARIIDLNYIDSTNRTAAYDSAFQIEMANTSGVVRSYSLQSAIFPDQAAMIAISAQVGGGGAQGYQNNTMLDFNNGLEDRILPKKINPSLSTPNSDQTISIEKLKSSLDILYSFFFSETSSIDPNSVTDQNLSSEYKIALKDIIAYFQGITSSNTKNRAIIPIKMSLTMDGIGGLVIGHLFKIPQQLLPKGYKYENSTGARLLQIITTLDHKIENGDWTTTIGAQQVVTNEPAGNSIAFNDLLKVNNQGKTIITVPSSSKIAPKLTAGGLNYPIVGNYIKVGSGGGFNATRNKADGGTYQHGGVDLAIPVGTPIYAVEDGIATIASDSVSGNYVQISHSRGTTGQLDRYTTYYFHLSSQAISNGKVTKGTIIGYSGNTGRSDGPHLHFEIRATGTNVKIDPGTLFPGF